MEFVFQPIIFTHGIAENFFPFLFFFFFFFGGSSDEPDSIVVEVRSKCALGERLFAAATNQPTMSESGSSWGAESRTVESSAVAAELQNLDEEIRLEFGGEVSVEEEEAAEDSSFIKQADSRVDSVSAPLSPYKGNVETRVLQADAELRSVLAKVAESKSVLAEVQRAAATAQEKSEESAAELEHVVGVISEVCR